MVRQCTEGQKETTKSIYESATNLIAEKATATGIIKPLFIRTMSKKTNSSHQLSDKLSSGGTGKQLLASPSQEHAVAKMTQETYHNS